MSFAPSWGCDGCKLSPTKPQCPRSQPLPRAEPRGFSSAQHSSGGAGVLPAETGGTRVPQRLHGPDFVCFRCTQRDQSLRYSNNAVRRLPGMSRGKKKSSFYASPWETGAVSSCWHQPWYVHCSLNLVDTNETSLGRSLAAHQQTEVGDLSLTEPRRNRLRGRTDTNSATAPKKREHENPAGCSPSALASAVPPTCC